MLLNKSFSKSIILNDVNITSEKSWNTTTSYPSSASISIQLRKENQTELQYNSGSYNPDTTNAFYNYDSVFIIYFKEFFFQSNKKIKKN